MSPTIAYSDILRLAVVNATHKFLLHFKLTNASLEHLSNSWFICLLHVAMLDYVTECPLPSDTPDMAWAHFSDGHVPKNLSPILGLLIKNPFPF